MTVSRQSFTNLVGKLAAERGGDGSLVFDVLVVAPLLGLSAEAFMEALRKGTVHQVHEQGTEEDSGKARVTFRHRARQAVLTLDARGSVLGVA